MPSTVDRARQHGLSVSSAYPWEFERKKVIVLKCRKCGMIKEKIMDECATVIIEKEPAVCGCIPAEAINKVV
jgi:hypothetical protein